MGSWFRRDLEDGVLKIKFHENVLDYLSGHYNFHQESTFSFHSSYLI